MKALLPVFCRPLGYVILVISMFIPFLLLMQGMVTDSNLLFYKECIKLLMILGAMMIILLYHVMKVVKQRLYGTKLLVMLFF